MRKSIIVSLAILVVLLSVLFSGLPFSLLRPVFHADAVNRYSREYGFDPLLITAIIKEESKFSRRARSHRGAIGLMQLMPPTAHELAAELGYAHPRTVDLEDPDINIRLGTYYLYKLRREFSGDMVLTLAAYNAGYGKVQGWYYRNPLISVKITDIPYRETKNYVHNILRTYQWLKKIQELKSRLSLKKA